MIVRSAAGNVCRHDASAGVGRFLAYGGYEWKTRRKPFPGVKEKAHLRALQ